MLFYYYVVDRSSVNPVDREGGALRGARHSEVVYMAEVPRVLPLPFTCAPFLGQITGAEVRTLVEQIVVAAEIVAITRR